MNIRKIAYVQCVPKDPSTVTYIGNWPIVFVKDFLRHLSAPICQEHDDSVAVGTFSICPVNLTGFKLQDNNFVDEKCIIIFQ